LFFQLIYFPSAPIAFSTLVAAGSILENAFLENGWIKPYLNGRFDGHIFMGLTKTFTCSFFRERSKQSSFDWRFIVIANGLIFVSLQHIMHFLDNYCFDERHES